MTNTELVLAAVVLGVCLWALQAQIFRLRRELDELRFTVLDPTAKPAHGWRKFRAAVARRREGLAHRTDTRAPATVPVVQGSAEQTRNLDELTESLERLASASEIKAPEEAAPTQRDGGSE